eukprot:204182-Prorocentrum_lima.AAC.1
MARDRKAKISTMGIWNATMMSRKWCRVIVSWRPSETIQTTSTNCEQCMDEYHIYRISADG